MSIPDKMVQLIIQDQQCSVWPLGQSKKMTPPMNSDALYEESNGDVKFDLGQKVKVKLNIVT